MVPVQVVGDLRILPLLQQQQPLRGRGGYRPSAPAGSGQLWPGRRRMWCAVRRQRPLSTAAAPSASRWGVFARKRWRNSRFRGYRAADPADHLQGPACLSGLLTLAIGRGRSARNYFPNPIVDKAIKVRVINHDPDLLILGKPGPNLMEQLLSAGGAPGVGAADYTVYVV